jgi:hypothetical protein
VRYHAFPDVVAEPIGKELVILNLVSGLAFRLNETGRQVWELAQQDRTSAEIAEQLATAYGIDTDRARADVSGILARLVHDRLMAPVEHVPSETGS